MKKLPVDMVLALILASMLLSACGAYQTYPSYLEPLEGDVQAVRITTVLRELRFAAMGSLRSYIYVNEANGNVLFSWPAPGGVGWVCLNGNAVNVCNALREIGMKGNLASVKDFGILLKGAVDQGYRPITAADLETKFPSLVASIMQSTTQWASMVIPSIVVMPVIPGFFENMPGTTTSIQ